MSDRKTHTVEAHDGHGSYAVTERWAWLPTLIVVNALTLVLSTVAAIGSADAGPLLLLGLMFPQVWGWFNAPWLGVITVAVVAIAAWIYAEARPAGTPFERRFTAGVTMGAFVAALTFLALALGLLAFLVIGFNMRG
ncbi:hypothetical protein ACFXQA_01500 [Microbacterium sp. P07]|uniref:hypothetical protein n=1 Tax=Microbacterium sp. P07 TaxID=3366952 RepID=UPI00374513FE